MKRLIQLLILGMCLLVSMPSEAQFLKKLQKKVQNAAEDKVTDKSANKTSEKVGEGMDDIFSIGKKKGDKKAKKKGNNNDIPNIFSGTSEKPRSSYHFSYLYEMKVTTKKHTGELSFLLHPNAEYSGMRMEQEGMQSFMIFDYAKETAFTFMENSGQKFMMGFDLDLDVDEDDIDDDWGNFKVTDIPGKTILGYACTGKRLENDEVIMNIYYTDKVPINMKNLFQAGENAGKKGSGMGSNPFQNVNLEDMGNSLLLYSETTDKKNGEKYTIEGIRLEQISQDFSTSGYQSF